MRGGTDTLHISSCVTEQTLQYQPHIELLHSKYTHQQDVEGLHKSRPILSAN